MHSPATGLQLYVKSRAWLRTPSFPFQDEQKYLCEISSTRHYPPVPQLTPHAVDAKHPVLWKQGAMQMLSWTLGNIWRGNIWRSTRLWVHSGQERAGTAPYPPGSTCGHTASAAPNKSLDSSVKWLPSDNQWWGLRISSCEWCSQGSDRQQHAANIGGGTDNCYFNSYPIFSVIRLYFQILRSLPILPFWVLLFFFLIIIIFNGVCFIPI